MKYSHRERTNTDNTLSAENINSEVCICSAVLILGEDQEKAKHMLRNKVGTWLLQFGLGQDMSVNLKLAEVRELGKVSQFTGIDF